jgi:hypothetical protein
MCSSAHLLPDFCECNMDAWIDCVTSADGLICDSTRNFRNDALNVLICTQERILSGSVKENVQLVHQMHRVHLVYLVHLVQHVLYS